MNVNIAVSFKDSLTDKDKYTMEIEGHIHLDIL